MKKQNNKRKMNKALTLILLLLCFTIINAMLVLADPLSVSRVTASHSTEGAYGIPENAVDGNEETAWQVAGDGVGESIRLEFPQEVTITRCSVIPGYDKIEGSGWNRDRWLSTNHVTEVEITWAGGGNQRHTFTDAREPQPVAFSNIRTNYIEINIRRTVPGSTGRQSGDTAISEIACYGTGPDGGRPSGASAAAPAPAPEEPALPTPAPERPASGGSERRAESPRSQPASQQPLTPERAGTAGEYSKKSGSAVSNAIPAGANGCFMMQNNELIVKLRSAFAGTGTISVSGVVSQASLREQERRAREQAGAAAARGRGGTPSPSGAKGDQAENTGCGTPLQQRSNICVFTETPDLDCATLPISVDENIRGSVSCPEGSFCCTPRPGGVDNVCGRFQTDQQISGIQATCKEGTEDSACRTGVHYSYGDRRCGEGLVCCAPRIRCEGGESRYSPYLNKRETNLPKTRMVIDSSSRSCGSNFCIPGISDDPQSNLYGSCLSLFSNEAELLYCGSLKNCRTIRGSYTGHGEAGTMSFSCPAPVVEFLRGCPSEWLPSDCFTTGYFPEGGETNGGLYPPNYFYTKQTKQYACESVTNVAGQVECVQGLLSKGTTDCLTGGQLKNAVCWRWRSATIPADKKNEVCRYCETVERDGQHILAEQCKTYS